MPARAPNMNANWVTLRCGNVQTECGGSARPNAVRRAQFGVTARAAHAPDAAGVTCGGSNEGFATGRVPLPSNIGCP